MRERERGCCLLIVTAAACGKEEDERSLPLRFLDCVFLSIVVLFTASGLSWFFPPLWVFHVTSCISTLFLFSVFISCIYILYSVVAERTIGSESLHLVHHGPRYFKDVPIFALDYSVLLQSVSASEFSPNSFLSEICREIVREVLLVVI